MMDQFSLWKVRRQVVTLAALLCAVRVESMSLHQARCSPSKATLAPSSTTKIMRGKEWFEAAVASAALEDDDLELLSTARQEGRNILAEYPELIPSAREEAWRFTDLKKFWRVIGAVDDSSAAAAESLVDADAWYLDVDADILCVVVDGVVSTELSRGLGTEEGTNGHYVGRARISDKGLLEEKPAEIDIERSNPNSAMGSAPWAALNAACMSDAVVVSASGDEKVSAHVVHVSTGRRPLAHPRLSVVAKDQSSVEIHQTFVSLADAGGPILTNSRTTLDVDERASVVHVYAAAHEAPNAVHVEACTANNHGSYEATVVCLGSEMARLGFDTALSKSEAKSTVNSLVLAGEPSNSVDFRTQIRHEVREAYSEQDVRIVAAEKSRATFKGRISVPQVAQLTDASQICRTALLSEQASVNVMPSLEIIANDVKCTHGATVADLDGEALFFLMARGLTRDAAQALLVRGFCDSLLDTLPDSVNPKLRSTIDAKIQSLVVQ